MKEKFNEIIHSKKIIVILIIVLTILSTPFSLTTLIITA